MPNNDQPIWQLLRQCARELTEAGYSPFTRRELIQCVQRHAPDAKSGSINPTIQGITDNLVGGAPGAVGKNILHSVGRNKFVLRSEVGANETESASIAPASVAKLTQVEWSSDPSRATPEKEDELRDELLWRLSRKLDDTDCLAEPEGSVSYRLPDGTELDHRWDILVSRPGSAKQVSIEIKYKSAVTDQFKCRSYDAVHTKKDHGEYILTVMIFARANSGISIDRARSICHPFDRFYGDAAAHFLAVNGLDELVADIRSFLL